VLASWPFAASRHRVADFAASLPRRFSAFVLIPERYTPGLDPEDPHRGWIAPSAGIFTVVHERPLWTEGRATQRCDPSAVPGAETGAGARLCFAPLLLDLLRDQHESAKPLPHDAAKFGDRTSHWEYSHGRHAGHPPTLVRLGPGVVTADTIPRTALFALGCGRSPRQVFRVLRVQSSFPSP